MSSLTEFWEEITDEAQDFWEDISEHLFQAKPDKTSFGEKPNLTALSPIRPAYLFADRIDNLIKIIFGLSIIVSGIGAAFWGFSSVSDLVKTLIDSFWGRLTLVIIGISYLIIGLWRFFHLHK